MNLLFIIPYVPTPIRVRPYNLIRALAARGHRITLATLWTDEAERRALDEPARWGVRVIAEHLPRARSLRNCLGALPTATPLQAVYCWSPALRARIEQELASPLLLGEGPGVRYAAVHVEHLRGAHYGLDLPGVPVVWDSVDCISYLFAQSARHSRSPSGRLLTRLDLARTRRHEGWLAGQFDRVLVTSPVDRAALHQVFTAETQRAQSLEKYKEKISASSAISAVNKDHIVVLPNGVDLTYFRPGDAPRDAETLVITGKMSYHANVTAVHHLMDAIMPRVWAQRPRVRVQVVGAYPPPALRRLAERFPGRVEVTGTVPHLRPYLQRATLAVAPVAYGAGIQNKVLEALACGTPVVATPQACSALEVEPGRDLLTAGAPDEFAGQVLRVLDDPALAAQLGAAGRRYVEQHHDWDAVAAHLEGIYREMT
jgi:glycosyltransferase involved in cell wall biosynthesis